MQGIVNLSIFSPSVKLLILVLLTSVSSFCGQDNLKLSPFIVNNSIVAKSTSLILWKKKI